MTKLTLPEHYALTHTKLITNYFKKGLLQCLLQRSKHTQREAELHLYVSGSPKLFGTKPTSS